MSDWLRDDVQETAVAAERWLFGMTGLSEDYARVRDDFRLGMGAVLHDAARGQVELLNAALFALHDVAVARDAVFMCVVSGCLNVEMARVREQYVSSMTVMTEEVAHGVDAVFDGVVLPDVLHDVMRVSECWLTGRVLADVLEETVRVHDGVFSGCLNSVLETARVSDEWFSGCLNVSFVEDVAHGADAVWASARSGLALVSRGALRDAVFARAIQGAFWHDRVAVLDRVCGDEVWGAMLWTANTDNWAVSRYAPRDVCALAVVDGTVWGLADDGVFALDGDDELISGCLKMGLVDCLGGGLQHPVASYVAYSREDDAVVDLAVTMPQSGRDERFVYRLARERADSLTTGRFVLGRGLRGRHFGFELLLQGKSVFVNDWTVDCVPTKRRV